MIIFWLVKNLNINLMNYKKQKKYKSTIDIPVGLFRLSNQYLPTLISLFIVYFQITCSVKNRKKLGIACSYLD